VETRNVETHLELGKSKSSRLNEAPEDAPLSFSKVFKNITSRSLPTALSFTFGLEIFLILFLLNRLHEDEDEVAAATLITLAMNTIVALGLAHLLGNSTILSNKIGQLETAKKTGENEDLLAERRALIANVNRNGLLLSLMFAPATIAAMIYAKPLLTHVFGQNEEVAEITQNFLRVYCPAILALGIRVAEEQTMFSFGRANAAMTLGLVNLGIGAGLSAWLGFGGAGMPKFGPAGIAAGFVVEAYLTAIAYGLYLGKHRDFSQFHFFALLKRVKENGKHLQELLKMGGPISFTIATEIAMSLSVGVFAGLVGTREQSAMSAVNQYVFFLLNFLIAFGMSTSQELSREIGAQKEGAQNFENASRIGKYGLLTSLMWLAPIPIGVAAYPNLLMFGSSDQDEIKALLQYLVPIMSLGVISDSVRYNLLQQLRSLGDVNFSTVIAVAGSSLSIAAAGILGLKTPLGIYGVATGYTSGLSLTALALASRWLSRIRPEKIKENTLSPPQEISVANTVVSLFGCRKFARRFARQQSQREEQVLLLEGSRVKALPGPG
jgi:MATE family multidrug resistance protein